MKKTATKNIQEISNLTSYSPSELQTAMQSAPAIIHDCMTELLKEIRRLQRQNAKEKVAHYSETEKIKAECAEEIHKDKVRMVITLPDNGRGKIHQKTE
jgi:nitrogen fixation/metabolism regulation signal transduction histidine kinase